MFPANDRVVKSGTAVILIKDGRVLVGKRKGSHGAGVYAFPGGHIDPTDISFKQAAEREVFEETGIECEVFKPDGIRDDLFTTYDILSEDGTKVYVTVYLLAQYKKGGTFIDHLHVKPLEDKCEVWTWATLDYLVQLVEEGGNKAWIPLDKLVPYLSMIIGTPEHKAKLPSMNIIMPVEAK